MIRASFLTSVVDPGRHWPSWPIVSDRIALFTAGEAQ
jgi:hypothetical protein